MPPEEMQLPTIHKATPIANSRASAAEPSRAMSETERPESIAVMGLKLMYSGEWLFKPLLSLIESGFAGVNA